MRNIMRIFASEVKLIGTNIITFMIVLGLVIMPSLFTWYNVLACWDVFGNINKLEVAVANADKGFESDMLPMKTNIGDSVVSALRANDSIHWVFVDEEEAIDGAASGRYYASVVIPEDFSERMLTFYSSNTESTELLYYSNEKINAISPQLLGQGANVVSYQVNEAFAESLNSIALSLVQSTSKYLGSEQGMQDLASVSESMKKVANRADQCADVLGTYSQLMASARELLRTSSTTSHELERVFDVSYEYLVDAIGSAVELEEAMLASLDAMDAAIDSSMDLIQSIIDSDIGSEGGSPDEVAANLRAQKAVIDAQIVEYNKILEELQKDPETNANAIASLQSAITELEELSASLEQAAQEVEASGAVGSAAWVKLKAQVALDAMRIVKAAFNETFRASLDTFSAQVASLTLTLGRIAVSMDGTFDAIGDDLYSASVKTVAVEGKIDDVKSQAHALAADLRTFSDELDQALATGSLEVVSNFLNSGVDKLSKALAAPVKVDRTAINQTENMGSSMFPFYAALALFVGALLSMVLVKPRVAQRVLDEFPEDKMPTSRQRFLGHFGVVAVISLTSSTVLGLGAIFFLGVHVVHPLLFMLALWVSGIVMSFIMYMLVASFANLGKAAGVLLLIIQVTGCGGSYPLAILPQFVQNVSAWVPAYHIVLALRAAMFGIYNGDFWIELGLVVLFFVPVLIAALVLNKPFAAFSEFYMNKAAKTKLLA